MFGKQKKDSPSKKKGFIPTNTPHLLNSLVSGSVIEGTINSEGDIRVDGILKGKLFCKSKVIIGPSGRIEGEIKCQNAVIEGSFEGLIEVKELLNVRDKARIHGDVQTNKLIVQSGAVFSVNCRMGMQQSNTTNGMAESKKASKAIIKPANTQNAGEKAIAKEAS